MDFDPNASGSECDGLFALPCSVDTAKAVVVPVPWDATSSQGWASAGTPDSVLAFSGHVELYDRVHGAFYQHGIAMDAIDDEIRALNSAAIGLQKREDFSGRDLTGPCERLNDIVFTQVDRHLRARKRVGLLGGDHSVSFGAIRAHLQRFPDMGVLQIDAHCDLREAFDGVQFSHASIMYNVLEQLDLRCLTQVGVRAFCEFEAQYVENSSRVATFFDADVHRMLAEGKPWSTICNQIVDTLPEQVYVSFDIDGLEPPWCPHTGTPVPGGLSYNDALYLLNAVPASGRQVVGFDLVEGGSAAYDAGIVAHLLYQLCALLLHERPSS